MRRFLIFFVVLTGAHVLFTVATLVIGTTLVLSDFDTGPTGRSALGNVVMAVHDLLEWPFRPLHRNASPWSIARGYVGIILNSMFCGLVATVCLELVRFKRVRTQAAG
jgi:hypothetical protein